MNGCVLSCGKTSMSWYTGACTLTGKASTNTHTTLDQHEVTTSLVSYSYDSWLSSSDVEGEVEELPHPERPWRVSVAPHTSRCQELVTAAVTE